MNRRSLLRGAMALPLSGSAMKAELARGSHAGVLGASMGAGHGRPPPAGVAAAPRSFTSWGSYWTAIKDEARENTRHVHQIDPDLCAMESLPFNTKFRIQPEPAPGTSETRKPSSGASSGATVPCSDTSRPDGD